MFLFSLLTIFRDKTIVYYHVSLVHKWYLFTFCHKKKSLVNQPKTNIILNKVIFIIVNVLLQSIFCNFKKLHYEPFLSIASKYISFCNSTYPDSIYLLKIKNGHIRTMCEISSKLTTKNLNIFHNLDQISPKRLFQSKTGKLNITIEFCIFQLV